jgi:hypothetical protein
MEYLWNAASYVASASSRVVSYLFADAVADTISNWLLSKNDRLSDGQRAHIKSLTRIAIHLFVQGRTDEMWQTMRNVVFLAIPFANTSPLLADMASIFPLLAGTIAFNVSSSSSSFSFGSRPTRFEEPAASSSSAAQDNIAMPEIDAVLRKHGVTFESAYSLPRSKRKALADALERAQGNVSCPITLENLMNEGSKRLVADTVAILEPMPDDPSHPYFVYFFQGSALVSWLDQGSQTNPMTRARIGPDSFVRLTQ